MKMAWKEIGNFIFSDENIKMIAAGKNFYEYEAIFNDLESKEFVEFLNFQFNRKSNNEIEILKIEF